MAHILLVDDEKKMRHLLAIMLSAKGYEIDQAGDGEEALAKLTGGARYDLVISDIKMPGLDGMGLLERIKEHNLPCPVIFITAFATVDSAVSAMRSGAVDYITKPFDEQRILLAVEKTLNVSRLMVENRDLKKQLKKARGYDEIICESNEMKAVMNIAARVAERDSTVLLTGDSGTGKEVIARYIHQVSSRRDGRFVPVNCAAISAGLVESELFGHKKGAFTNATQSSQGRFEYADNGTLFLDEIGDLPYDAQSKLLRTLQDKKVQHVGGNREIDVNVRVMCATNQDLEKLVAQNKFRKDLFYRINVFPIHMQTLKEKPDDIIPLANHFIRRFAEGARLTLTATAEELLKKYSWPGNVRELANAIERAVILIGDSDVIGHETLSFLQERPENKGNDNIVLPAKGISLENLEREMIRQALTLASNNQTAAAKLLGMTRAKFRVILKKI